VPALRDAGAVEFCLLSELRSGDAAYMPAVRARR
jgi:hypothetical protein